MNTWLNSFLQRGLVMSTPEGQLLMGWGKQSFNSQPNPQAAPSFYLPDFFLSNDQWITFECCEKVSKEGLLQLLQANTGQPPVSCYWKNSGKETFFDQFYKLQQLLTSGALIKAVPFVAEESPGVLSQEQLIYSLKAALNYLQLHPGYLYGYWDEDQGILGVTPELLFQAERNSELKLSTSACAGTLGRLIEPQDFLKDPKELHEHQVVIDGIIEALSPYGSVTIGELQLLKLGRLTHLLTPIHASLDSKLSFPTVLKALHPTPALGAFPKQAGWQWLLDYQSVFKRHRYGAPVGYVGEGDREATFYVAIRNVQWDSEKKYIAAGCGVVARSRPEKEWDEIQLKLQAIKEILQL